MHEKQPDSQKVSHKREDDLWLGVTPAEWIISGTVGIVSAIVAGASKVRSSFYEEVKEWPFIKELYVNHSEKLAEINKVNVGKPEHWKQHSETIDQAKAKFGETLDAELHQKWGITPRSSKWLSRDLFKDLTYGTYQRWKFAGTNTENKIVFNAIVGMVLGSAATLSFFNGVASRHKIERIEDAVTTDKSRS